MITMDDLFWFIFAVQSFILVLIVISKMSAMSNIFEEPCEFPPQTTSHETDVLALMAILEAKKFIVTGSLALAKYGLLKSSDVKDLDILLSNPTGECLERLKKLDMDHRATKDLSEYPEPDGTQFNFIFNTKKVDVFIINDEDSLRIDGIEWALIPNIVSAKLKFNRPKDWIQLRRVSRVLFKQEAFDKFLNTRA